jgi:hypothetical protein
MSYDLHGDANSSSHIYFCYNLYISSVCLGYPVGFRMELVFVFVDYLTLLSVWRLRELLQKSWQHYFSEISKAPTRISKFASERQQRLISNHAAR